MAYLLYHQNYIPLLRHMDQWAFQ